MPTNPERAQESTMEAYGIDPKSPVAGVLQAAFIERAAALTKCAELEPQTKLIPGFIYGKTMLVPVGIIGDLVALKNRIDHLTAAYNQQKERAEKLEKAIGAVYVTCENFHHDPQDRHEFGETCPPLERFLLATPQPEEKP